MDFLDDDGEITFDDNNSETLNSLDVSDIGPNIVIPGGGVGWTPTRDASDRVYLPDLYRYTSVKYSPPNQRKSAKNTV